MILLTKHLIANDIVYQSSPSFSLQNISLSFQKEKITSIIGPNGSGKSTLLKVFTKLIKPDAGMVIIDGESISTIQSKRLAKKITMLSQVQNNEIDLTVRELVSHGRLPHRKWHEALTTDDQSIIDWAISITNLEHLANQQIQLLSGGERQRAWIAMAVVQSPDILLLDEPTTYLDISHQLEIMELVHYLNKELNMTIVMVLHDINQAAQYSDYLIVMKDGELIKQGRPKEVITKELFRDVFLIHTNITYKDGIPSFTPIGLVQSKIQSMNSK